MKKVDNRLQKALDKAAKQKRAEQRKSDNASQIATDEHNKYIKKWLPKANKWIKEKLFAQITQAEAEGVHYILLGRYEDCVPSEVIFHAAKKIKGLRPRVKYPSIYEGGEFVGSGDPNYSIEWDSTDPNDYRDD